MNESIWLVEDENGQLQNIFVAREYAEKFIAENGNALWTISEDSWC